MDEKHLQQTLTERASEVPGVSQSIESVTNAQEKGAEARTPHVNRASLLSQPDPSLRQSTGGKSVWSSNATRTNEPDVLFNSSDSQDEGEEASELSSQEEPSQPGLEPDALRPTTGGKTVLTVPKEAIDEELMSDTETTNVRATTGGKTVASMTYHEPPPSPQNFTSHIDQIASVRPSKCGKTVVQAAVEMMEKDEDMSDVQPRKTVSDSQDAPTQFQEFSFGTDTPYQRPREGGKTVLSITDMLQSSPQCDNPEDSQSVCEESDVSDPDDEEAESVENPSTDIRLALDDALTGDSELTGTFAFSRTYSDAPNPVLDVAGLGTIGLPLSVRDADAIKAQSSQAPFGMADRTVVDKTVRDTWEIDAHQVNFRNNKEWSHFLARTVTQVCEDLGVNHAASRPRCELYKLLLYESGSHFLPHVDTEKQDRMFATIVVVLPSEFTGGMVRVSHSGLAEEYDCSSTSLTKTTVLAWYTDVMHEVKPITSGYRLALSYNLIHTTTSLRPALGEQTKLIGKLRHVLLSWKHLGEEDSPEKIIYLLNHQYSQANLSGSALKGADAHKISLLDMLARAHGFHLGLASIVCHQSGSAEDDGPHYYNKRRGRYGYSSDDDDEDNDDDVEMGEVHDTDMTIKNLVDLDGSMMQDRLNFVAEAETIPADLEEMVTSGDVDEQQYEGYMGNGAGCLERWYRRTALVIWPSWSNIEILSGGNGFAYACRRIAESTSTTPTQAERELVDIALARTAIYDREEVIKIICKAARSWGDLSLWIRAVKASDADSGIKNMHEKNILSAVKVFGFEPVRHIIENTLLRDSSTLDALRFLHRFEEWLISRDGAYVPQATSWIPVWRKKLLESLKPFGRSEVQSLVDLSLRFGGIDHLERTLIPQIRLVAGPLQLLSCASHLHCLSALSPEEKSRLVYGTIHAAIAKCDFNKPDGDAVEALSSKDKHVNLANVTSTEVAQALLCIDVCLDTGHHELISNVVAKLLDSFAGTPSDTAQQRARDILLPLTSVLAEEARQRGPECRIPDLKKLCDIGSKLYLDSITQSPLTVVKEHICSLFQAAICAGEPGLVLTQFIPKLEASRLSAQAIKFVIQELQERRAILEASQTEGNQYHAAIVRLVGTYGAAVDLRSIPAPVYQRHAYYGRQHTVPGTQHPRPTVHLILDALDFCAGLGVPGACCDIVSRVLPQTTGQQGDVCSLLFGLIPGVKSLLAKHGYTITSPDYSRIFQIAMVFWVGKVLGRPPAPDSGKAQLKRMELWTCKCDHCTQVLNFLRNEGERSKTWAGIGYKVKQHLEKELKNWCRGVASWEVVSSSPQGIKVTKSIAIYQLTRWRSAKQDGLRILDSISTDAGELQSVLGDTYATITSALATDGTRTSASGAATSATGPSTLQRALKTMPTAAAPAVGPRHIAATNTRPSTGAPPAKRRKTAYNDQEVIDLTSD